MKFFKVLLVVMVVSVVSGCAGWQNTVKTITDVAGGLCDVIAAEQLEADKDSLDGMTIKEWCAVEENVANILDVVLSMKDQATEKAGFGPEDGDD